MRVNKQAKLSDTDATKILESQKWSDVDKKFYQDIIAKWTDAERVASATARIALATPVKDLQAIQRNLEAKQSNTQCEAVLKEQLNTAFSTEIQSYIEFMQQHDDEAKKLLGDAEIYSKNALVVMSYCDKGKIA